MRVVLDTNVIISGLLFPGGTPDRIFRAVLMGRIQNVTSPELIQEFQNVLRKKFRLSPEKRAPSSRLILESSELVYPLERLNVIKADEKDNRVLECAVAAHAEAIVSGDQKHIVPIRLFRGIPIFSPSAFVQKIGLL